MPQYVGQTKRQMKVRVREHIYNARVHKIKNYPYIHFNLPHLSCNDMSFQIVSKLDTSKNVLEIELSWIKILQTTYALLGST